MRLGFLSSYYYKAGLRGYIQDQREDSYRDILIQIAIYTNQAQKSYPKFLSFISNKRHFNNERLTVNPILYPIPVPSDYSQHIICVLFLTGILSKQISSRSKSRLLSYAYLDPLWILFLSPSSLSYPPSYSLHGPMNIPTYPVAISCSSLFSSSYTALPVRFFCTENVDHRPSSSELDSFSKI